MKSILVVFALLCVVALPVVALADATVSFEQTEDKTAFNVSLPCDCPAATAPVAAVAPAAPDNFAFGALTAPMQLAYTAPQLAYSLPVAQPVLQLASHGGCQQAFVQRQVVRERVVQQPVVVRERVVQQHVAQPVVVRERARLLGGRSRSLSIQRSVSR